MGKNQTSKHPTRGVRKTLNYELRITSMKLLFHCSFFLCALGVAAGNLPAEDFAVNQERIDWIAEKTNLEQAIRTGSVEQKRDALYRVRNLESEEASRIAVPALDDKSEIVRATAAFSVVFLPKDEALNDLLPLLRDKKELVRREAARALGKIRNPNATNALLQVFQKDKITDVKNACIVALGEIGDASAVEALARILQNKPKKENPADEFLRRSAARAIGQIAQIIQTNKVEISTPESFLPEKYNPPITPKYLYLINDFPVFRPANNVLIQILGSLLEFTDVKREAAFALGAIGDEASQTVLLANAKSEDDYLAQIAKEALRKLERIQVLRKLEKSDSTNK